MPHASMVFGGSPGRILLRLSNREMVTPTVLPQAPEINRQQDRVQQPYRYEPEPKPVNKEGNVAHQRGEA
jgi:hypothetical protein